MTTYTFYIHLISGDIATRTSWHDDYTSMDAESWHGKPAEECNPDKWIEDGYLKPVDLHSDDNCTLTNRVFGGWWGDVADGEKYMSEWECSAIDDDGNRYRIFWMFPAVKGEEPDDDAWPWSDESFISRVESV